MYAVIKTGGKQYRVAPGDKLRVETLNAEEGDSVDLASVLMLSDGDKVTLGAPEIAGASVSATVLTHGRAKKIDIVKFRRRKHYRRQMGHRQNYTELQITGINGSDGTAMASAPIAAATAAPVASAPAPAPSTPPPEAVATSAVAAEKGKFQGLAAPQGDKDDLTLINGIGPVIEETLNEMGIFHYHQIAGFTEEEVGQVDEEISFPGRIEREDWIAQAKALVG